MDDGKFRTWEDEASKLGRIYADGHQVHRLRIKTWAHGQAFLAKQHKCDRTILP